MPKQKIIIDTDIGDDIDDALMLYTALGSPEFEILGVTTVYGDVIVRTKIARKLLKIWNRADIPVHTGFERPLAWSWLLGTHPENPSSQKPAVEDETEPVDRTVSASQFIINTIHANPGEVIIATIGAKTNIAAALCNDPSIAPKIKAIYSNAGYFPPKNLEPEWNVKYDPVASQVLSRSGVPWYVLSVDAANNIKLMAKEFEKLANSNHPAAQFLCELIVLWARNKHAQTHVKKVTDVDNAHIADIDTLLVLLFPDSLELKKGQVEVNSKGGVTFTENQNGNHMYAVSYFAEKYRQEVIKRIMNFD
jgi:inosine-uridine nucleoside N-ribohydrolase